MTLAERREIERRISHMEHIQSGEILAGCSHCEMTAWIDALCYGESSADWICERNADLLPDADITFPIFETKEGA